MSHPPEGNHAPLETLRSPPHPHRQPLPRPPRHLSHPVAGELGRSTKHPTRTGHRLHRTHLRGTRHPATHPTDILGPPAGEPSPPLVPTALSTSHRLAAKSFTPASDSPAGTPSAAPAAGPNPFHATRFDSPAGATSPPSSRTDQPEFNTSNPNQHRRNDPQP